MTDGGSADPADEVIRALNALGISRNDRTAMVDPNGMRQYGIFRLLTNPSELIHGKI